MANKLQSKVAMALVSLSNAAAFFEGGAMLMASTVKMPMIRISFLFILKSLACLCRGARQDETQYLSGPGEFSDSLWARIRRSRTNVGPRIQDPEENESVDSKTNFFKFSFDRVRSWESYSLYCTTILSGAQTMFEHQCDVITF